MMENRFLRDTITAFRILVRDPHTGGHLLSDDSWYEMSEWCENNCVGQYWIGMGHGHFELKDDATLFSMRWAE